MELQSTLSIIKPDAVERDLIGKIFSIIEENSLKIVAINKLQLSLSQAQTFYQIHSERAFFNDLVSYMTRSPVVVSVLYGKQAVATYRKVIGETNPANAAQGTIRNLFAKDIQENSVHGSDSEENAAKEIKFFFADYQIYY